MAIHRIDLVPATKGRAVMLFWGEVIGKSSQPLFDAARYLLETGVAFESDRIETWRGDTMCLAAPVGVAAGLEVRDLTYERYVRRPTASHG